MRGPERYVTLLESCEVSLNSSDARVAALLAVLVQSGCLGTRDEPASGDVHVLSAALSASTSAARSCGGSDAGSETACERPLTVSVAPLANPGVRAGTPVTYTVSITNENASACEPVSLSSFVLLPRGDFYTLQPNTHVVPSLAGGSSTSLPIELASGEETEPGSYPLTFQVETGGASAPIAVNTEYIVAEPAECHVKPKRELLIRDLSVVDDPVRTQFGGPAGDPRVGAWSFERLMQRLSPTDAQGPAVTEAVLRSFLSEQTVNGFKIAPRTQMDPLVLQNWPRSEDGNLVLARAPLRLLAIANRLDIKDLSHGKAGEGRFMYGVLDRDGQPMLFTVIFEYLLPAQDEAGFRAWADRFHALGALPFPSEQYNEALQAITDAFTARGALPGAPNGSALLNFRTNEIALALDNQWELREFHLSAETGLLTPGTLFLTPDRSFNFSPALARFINENEASILAETHQVPDMFLGAPFSAAAVFNNVDAWDAPGAVNPEARHKFSLNTCSGCHGAESRTELMHVHPRLAGVESFISRFLTGQSLPDQLTGQHRRFNELRRRRELLEATVCP